MRVAVVGGGSSGAVHRSRLAISLRALLCAGLVALLAGGVVFVGVRAGQSGAVAGHARAPGQGLLSLPLTLRGPLSASLGAQQRGYDSRAAAGGFAMQNPAQRLSARFDATGAQIGSGAVHVNLSLQSVGYGSALRPLPTVAPRVRGNRVSYDYPGLSAWYANGPLGLEQGFTVARPHADGAGGALTLALGLTANAPVSLEHGGRGVIFGHPGRASLRYSGLSVSDARGHGLPGWLELHAGRLLLRVDTRGAAYPLRIDPFVQQGGKLTAGEEIGAAKLGYSLAMSSNGETALIGGGADNGEVGAAWVFTRSGSTWTQQGPKLTGAEEIGKGHFGCCALALSSDGDTALIGGYAGNNKAGAAWVFTRSGSTWTQQGPKLTGAEEIGEGEFGFGVALSSDGNTALIGGPLDGKIQSGSAWVFTRSGSTWTQQGPKLTGGEENTGNISFGHSVALSSDGNTALIGAPNRGVNREGNVGAAWVFTRSGSTWTQQGRRLTGGPGGGGGVFGHFGWSVALSADGNTALIGGPEARSKHGEVWVFARSGSTWAPQGETLHSGSEEVGDSRFGETLALSENGNTALIGGDSDNGGAGAAWVFARSGSSWTQQGIKLTASDEAGKANFGFSVALSGEGNRALIGGPFDNEAVGAAWAFESVTTLEPVITGVKPSKGPAGTSVTITGTNLAEANLVEFGTIKAGFMVNSATSITAVSPEEIAGKVDIRVSTPGGFSPIALADRYTVAPAITALSPNAGPAAGGTSVNVKGTGFGLATVFKFGSTLATSVNCVSSTECTLVSPAHAAGKVVVKATVNKVTSESSPGDRFTYE